MIALQGRQEGRLTGCCSALGTLPSSAPAAAQTCLTVGHGTGGALSSSACISSTYSAGNIVGEDATNCTWQCDQGSRAISAALMQVDGMLTNSNMEPQSADCRHSNHLPQLDVGAAEALEQAAQDPRGWLHDAALQVSHIVCSH